MAMQLFYMPAVTPKAGAKVLIINEKRRMKSEEFGSQVTSFNIFSEKQYGQLLFSHSLS